MINKTDLGKYSRLADHLRCVSHAAGQTVCRGQNSVNFIRLQNNVSFIMSKSNTLHLY